MKKWLLLLLAFALPPMTAFADVDSPKYAEENSNYVFLGTCSGSDWIVQNSDAKIKCPPKMGNYALSQPIEAMLHQSLKAHEQPRPMATETKRVTRLSKVTILGLHVCGDENVKYIWGDIGKSIRSAGTVVGQDPARYFGEMEAKMETYKLRCGCDASVGVLLSTDVDGTISECQECGAAWSEFAERLTELDFGPIGGPKVRVLLPYSSPA